MGGFLAFIAAAASAGSGWAAAPPLVIDDQVTTVATAVPPIRRSGGFVDKYIGDAIMALFPDEPDAALVAAAAMHHELDELNRASPDAPILTGLGLHFGRVMLGTVGESERMEATVVADAVNVASRLEGLTKQFAARVLVSGAAVSRLKRPERFSLRPLGPVRVMGKGEPVELFELLDADPQPVRARKESTRVDFERGLGAMRRGLHEDAALGFEAVLAADPADVAARYLRDQCDVTDASAVRTGTAA